MDASTTPAIVRSIYDAMYGGLPDAEELSSMVVPYATLLKVVQLGIVVASYPSSASQPFSRNVFFYGAISAAAKLVTFYGNVPNPTLDLIFEDMCFAAGLIGVIVTMSFDFLWALSSSMEDNALFKRSLSESDFVAGLNTWQPLVMVYLVFIRHVPFGFWEPGSRLASHVNIAVLLHIAFGFIWYCLWKVTGTSNTKRFKDAYRAAFTVNLLSHAAATTYTISFIPIFYDNTGQVNEYYSGKVDELCLLVTHFLETSVILLLVCYFAFLKAPPADLQKNKGNWAQTNGVLRAKKAFLKGKKAS